MRISTTCLVRMVSAVFAALLFMHTPQALCATNPFITPQKQETPAGTAQSAGQSAVRHSSCPDTGSFSSGVMPRVTLLQKDIRAQLTGFAREIKKNPYGKSLWLFLAFSFAYGVVHAVGPGHGKSVVCAYFISRRGSMAAASFMSWLITLVHVGSATVTVCLAYFLFKSGMSGFEEFNNHLQTASFGLVALIGLWFTIDALMSFRRKQEESPQAKQGSLKEIGLVALVTGLVPCPGAAIILVYTLSTGILSAGLAAMIFLATGMAVTTSLFAFAAAKTRRLMDKAPISGKLGVIYSCISLCGGLVILTFGSALLAAHLS
ncbi:nickel/cobalt transporter [Maridesulfovibrio sp. FT414]|uniref:nickel/cobalt transporter n=1 Tax=Maridesulfovibrio sp. FT414 TaxID=2979469 RepID=UPI003D806DF3